MTDRTIDFSVSVFSRESYMIIGRQFPLTIQFKAFRIIEPFGIRGIIMKFYMFIQPILETYFILLTKQPYLHLCFAFE